MTGALNIKKLIRGCGRQERDATMSHKWEDELPDTLLVYLVTHCFDTNL